MKYAAPLFHLSGMDVTVVEVGLSLDGFADMESMRMCRRSYSLVPRVLVHFQYASTKGLSLWTVQSQVPFHTEWHELQSQVQDFFQGGDGGDGGGGGIRPPLALACLPPLGYAENSSLHNDTINGKLCLCENSPRFHQIVSNKRSKIKIVGQKAERNPAN